MNFILIRLDDQDGEVLIEQVDPKRLEKQVEKLHSSDYAVVYGEVIKGFHQKLNPKALKNKDK